MPYPARVRLIEGGQSTQTITRWSARQANNIDMESFVIALPRLMAIQAVVKDVQVAGCHQQSEG